MDFDFTEDQQSLRDAVARWVDKGYSFERRRAIVNAGGFDRTAYGELAELGLTALTVPEDDGGMGLGAVDAMIVMEELGRGIVLEPLTQTLVVSNVLRQFAPEAVRQQWLPRMASGEALVVLAQQEVPSRYRPDLCEATAAKADNAYTVNATKNVVPAGDKADAWLVSARLDGVVALFLVERNAQGASSNGYLTQDGSRAADVFLQHTPATLVTTEGIAALELAMDTGIAASSAYAVGAMEKTLAVTAEYMNQRKQFGVAIATFQALRHRIADMKMQLELARSMSYFASLKLGEEPGARRRALSQAKVQLGQSMRFVGQQAVQLHGGIGVTDEYIVSHYFKTLTQLEMSFGDTLYHLGQVSDRMKETAGVFG
ncbi:acyl-CoA dehydrogenase family protein [Diaphorobacter aerolatus]|uniref:Acyl-CoA dehydrogenase family protein n=1 Tax=Diaphorobacter aerolatus TaxID=1288495 RepID=A0A7H0GNC3_9BURK|nr:acyl-CoA dehydrogenase family protein [Diaphorobacter aerolatus]QNP49789.1 acyl-CoA dehydrogenase family protein [Diaphorobacter aerolatus]